MKKYYHASPHIFFFQKKDFQPEVKATHLARQLELVKLKSRCADPSKLVSKF